MKKFLLTALVILMTCMSAQATQFVRYSITGRPIVRSSTHFGRNALYTPANRMRAGARSRAYAREKAITRAISSMGQRCYAGAQGGYIPMRNSVASTPIATQSRFNKNYVIRTPKSYTRNGITYYN